MTYTEIEERLQKIESNKGDYEVAHGLEIELYLDFIRHVATAYPALRLSDKARKVLSARDIQFPRYTA